MNRNVIDPDIEDMDMANIQDDERKLLAREVYIPWYLVKLANAMTRGASRTYLKLYGIGVVEWRILSVLAIEAECPASRICEILEMDKASASRSIKYLEAQGIVMVGGDQEQRSKPLTLTPAGLAMHDEILAIAMEREKLLLSGFSPVEHTALLTLLARLVDNVDKVDAYEKQITHAMAEG